MSRVRTISLQSKIASFFTFLAAPILNSRPAAPNVHEFVVYPPAPNASSMDDPPAVSVSASASSSHPLLTSTSPSNDKEEMEVQGIRESPAVTSRWVASTTREAGWAMSFVHSLPRAALGGGTTDKHFSRPVTELDWNSLLEEPYIRSLAIMWLLCFITAGCFLLGWVLACGLRSCCNTAGKRWATQFYSPKSVKGHAICLAAMAVLLGVACAYGWTANVQVTDAIDESFLTMDNAFDFYIGFSPVLSSIVDLGNRAILRGQQLQALVAKAPSSAALATYSQCFRDIVAPLQQSEQVSVGLSLAGRMYDRGQSLLNSFADTKTSAQNLSALSSGLNTEYTELTSLKNALATAANTNVTSLQQKVIALVDALATPRTALTNNVMPARVATTTTAKEAISSITEAITALQTSLAALPDLAALRSKVTPSPQPYTALKTGLNQLKTGVAEVPNAQLLASNIETSIGTTSPYNNAPLYTAVSVVGTALLNIRPAFQLIPSVTDLKNDIAGLATVPVAAAAALNAWKNAGLETTYLASADMVSQVATWMKQFVDGADYATTANAVTVSAQLLAVRDLLTAQTCINATRTELLSFETYLGTLPPLAHKAANGAGFLAAIVNNAGDFRLNSDAATSGLPTIKTAAQTYIGGAFTTAKNQLGTCLTSFKTLETAGIKDLSSVLTSAIAAFNTVGPPSLPTFSTSLTTIQNSVSMIDDARNAVANARSAFDTLGNDYPSLTSSVIDPLRTMQTSLAGLSKPIADALDYMTMSQAAFDATGGLPTNIKTSLLNAIDSLISAKNGLTSTFNLLTSLNSLVSSSATVVTKANSVVASVSPSQGIPEPVAPWISSVQAILPSLQPSAKLASTVTGLVATNSLTQISPQLNALDDYQTTLGPNLTSYLTATQGTTNPPGITGYAYYADSNAYPLAQPNGGSGDDAKGAVAASVVEAELSAVTQLVAEAPQDQFAKLPSYASSIASSLVTRRDYVDHLYAEYQSVRTSYKKDSDQWDGVRILFLNLLVLLPMVLALLSFISCPLKRHQCAMISAVRCCNFSQCYIRTDSNMCCLSHPNILCYLLRFVSIFSSPSLCFVQLLWFPLIIVAWMVVGVTLPFAAIASDHCDDFAAQIALNLRNVKYSKEQVSFLNLTSDIVISDYVSYFLKCQGEEPELVQRLNAPASIFAAQGLNMTDVRLRMSSVQGVTPSAPLLAQINALSDLQAEGETAIRNFRALILCNRIKPVYDSSNTAICKNAAPNLALAVVMLFIISLISFFGICCSMRAYKRFNYRWQMTSTGIVKPVTPDLEPGDAQSARKRMAQQELPENATAPEAHRHQQVWAAWPVKKAKKRFRGRGNSADDVGSDVASVTSAGAPSGRGGGGGGAVSEGEVTTIEAVPLSVLSPNSYSHNIISNNPPTPSYPAHRVLNNHQAANNNTPTTSTTTITTPASAYESHNGNGTGRAGVAGTPTAQGDGRIKVSLRNRLG